MSIKDIFNWVKGFFVEVKIETYANPTKPVEPWPFPVVMGDHAPKEPCAKKTTKRKPIDKDKSIKSMKKSPAKMTVPKNETAKKAATKRAKKGK